MNVVFLRGSVPPKNENPEKLLYETIETCEDVWTQLFYYLTRAINAKAEILYDNGDREFRIDDDVTEKWVHLSRYTPPFTPDLIVCRGGFPYYDTFLRNFPKSKKVYYGAGRRFYPTTEFTEYDLFLCDSKSQRDQIRAKGKTAELFIKPAATMFSPRRVEKAYDICFTANATQKAIKRHAMFIKQFAGKGYKILSLGNLDKNLIRMAHEHNVNITWNGWALRNLLPEKISQCRVGLCCSTNADSCPRVIPEYLACGLPVVATNNINFWHDKYITPSSGVLVDEDCLVEGVEIVYGKGVGAFAHEHYKQNIGMPKAVAHLRRLIGEHCI